MSSRRAKRSNRETTPPAPRVSYRPSPRQALQISLGFHALLVLALFRMVSGYAGQPEAPLHIVVRGTAPRPAATPSFVTTPLAEAEVRDHSVQPPADVDAVPHQAASFAAAPLSLPGPAATRTPRVTVPATLPSIVVVLPAFDDTPVELPATPLGLTQSPAFLDRPDTLPEVPLAIASRPIYGPRPERPLGWAELPALRGEPKQRHPADAFAHRHAGLRTPAENRTAIDRGLEFLARTQCDDGRWQFRNLREVVDANAESPSTRADAAATGLALLAFLGAGHDHCDGRYRLVVDDALQYLVRTQQPGGAFFPEDARPTGQLTRFYSHGIATLALCEAFGMTGDAALRQPAQRALDYLVGAQYAEPGSWRYLPGVDADAAAIGWQLATLRSGQLAGLLVRPETLAQIRRFLAGNRQRPSAEPNAVATAVGLAVELHIGSATAGERLRPAAEQLLANLPQVSDPPSTTEPATPASPQRDTYYWYYGSEAMFYVGGDDWQAWSRQLFPRLIQSQAQTGPLAGSWDPAQAGQGPVYASSGRLYVTAMNLLSLEIQNRHLPPELPQAARSAEANQRDSEKTR
jgi:hypothetical protein